MPNQEPHPPFRYEEAIAELHAIQQALENGEVLISEMQNSVQRATELMQQCKAMLRTTEEEVSKMLHNSEEA